MSLILTLTPIRPCAGAAARENGKEADREAAAVGDVITYKITVTNIGSVELKDIPVRDTNDGSGRITAAGGPGYTWQRGQRHMDDPPAACG